MANLLRWSAGMALPKKKEENNVFQTSTPLISSLKTMSPTINNRISSVSRPSNSFSSTNNALNNSLMRAQQINERIRQQAEQRRQQELQRQRQEEQQRQQRLAEQQRQQEQRKQQEQAKKLAQQRQQEQKQRNLLNSAGLGNFGFNTDIRSNIETQRKLRQQAQERAAAKKQAEEAKNPWKKYYDEEKQKVRDQAFKNNWGDSTLQDIFNAGWDSRLAETRAKNRYASELLNQGQTEKAKEAANEAVNTARQNSKIEHAKGKALGATYDSEIKDNPFLATFNAIRSADIGNAMVGGAEGGLADVAKFLINTGQYAIPYYGWASGIMRGAPSATEAIVGRGLDDKTGDYKDLSLLERLGRGVSGGIDIVGPKLNASEKLASTIINLARGGAKNVATQGGKAALMELLKNALGEGIEEGVQEIGDYFGEGNTLTDENGNISGEKIGEMAGRAGQAAGLGALGGGLMSGANIAINKTANAINTRRNANVDTNVDTNIDTNIAEGEVVNNDVKVNEDNNVGDINDTNIDPSKVKTTRDGTMVKTNADGSATRLSDNELANVVEQSSYQPTKALGTNPFIDNSVKLTTSGTEDINTLLERANNGDESAKQKLAEILQQGLQENQNSDWRGKSVEEVINPEDNAEPKTIYHGTPNTFEDFDENLPSVWFSDSDKNLRDSGLTIKGDSALNVMERILPNDLKLADEDLADRLTKQQLIDRGYEGIAYTERGPNGDETYYEIFNPNKTLSKVSEDNQIDIKTPSELDETPEILDNERAINDDSEELANAISELYGPMPEDTQVAPSYDEDLSMQKIADVLDGKTSFDDYIGDQRELLWKSFKDSQRGVEQYYLRQDSESNDITRRVTESNNGTLYRQLYQEYGGKPTKADFNEALNDVLINGKDSKYYDGFREFDHDGERSIFDFNQGNENIDMILDLKEEMGQRTPSNQEVATGTEPLGKAEDGTAEFVQRYTKQTKLNGEDNSKVARDARLESYMNSLKGDNNSNAQKVYELYKDQRGKFIVTTFSPDLIARYANDGKVALDKNLQAILTQNFVRHADEGGHFTGIRLEPDKKTGIQIDANPLTKSEFGLLNRVLTEADTIIQDKKHKSKEGPRLQIDKRIGSNNYRALAEVVRGGKDLKVFDFFKTNKTPLTGDFAGFRDSGLPSLSGAENRVAAALSNIIAEDNASVNGKKSQFAENTSGNRNFSTETRGELKSDPLTYKPTTNEERLTRANEILSTKSSDEIDNYLRENFFNVKPKDADSADMVLAGEYAKMLDAKGQYDRSTEIINRMSEIGTKQGQNIQALSLMMNRSPEGIANMAQTAIKKSGGEMTPELRRQIVEKTQEIGRTRNERTKLSEENAKISEQIMNGKGDLAALRKRQMQIGQAYRLNLDQEGRQFSRLSDVVSKNSPDKRSVFGSIWRAGLLSGPRTHTGNAVSNTFQNVLNAGADRFASGLDWARTKITGGEREVVSSAGGRKEGLKRGLKAAGEVLKTGDNLWESTDTILGKSDLWGQGGELEFKNKVANNMVAKPTNYVFRAMSAGDLPFRYAAFENAIRTEAKRQGINQGYKGQALQDYINSRVATPDPELQAYGVRKGNESVYDMDTKLSDLMNRIDKYIDSQDNKVVKNIMKGGKTLVAPFVKVPSKVLSTAVDYSPLGSVKAIVNKIGSKGYTTGQFETDLAKSGLGTAGFVGLGYALSAAGLLTGGYPDSQEERDRWRAEGIEPNSIKIGDKYLSLNYLGPASMLMAMGSGVQQRQANGEDPLAITQGVLTDTMTTFLDQSYVQGLNNVLNAVTDSKRYGESYINSLARGVTPNLFRQLATATDPKQRQVDNPLEAIISGIPGASQTLDAKVDVYGREIENKQTLPLGQAWDALKLSNSRETNDVIDEVNRLHNIDPSNKDLQVTPPQAQSTISVNGVNVKLTDDQKTQLQKDIGEAAVASMRQVINSSEYKNLTDEQKAKALDKARGDAQSQVRKQFIEANNITSDNNPGTKNSGGSISDNYANKAISNATSNRTNGTIGVNDSISNESKSILSKYNSMTSDDWNKYLYGTSAEAAAAEYNLALAKYENDSANGDLNEAQKIKREKELAKLYVSQKWTKNYRDAYSLAGTKADMQAYLNTLDGSTRAETVSILNGLNNAMYEAGIIQASTYKTRYNAINNTTSSRSSRKSSKSSTTSDSEENKGISSAEASAIASLAKTMSKADDNVKVKTPEAPTTKRKMSRTKSSGNSTGLKTYTPSLAKNVTVTKGASRSIV